MDQITEKYNQAAQKQMNHIEAVSQAFQQQCSKLKDETEKLIATIDQTQPNAKELEGRYKVKLKRDLKQVLTEYEKELRRSFGESLNEMEVIYRQKEAQRIGEIEQEILSM